MAPRYSVGDRVRCLAHRFNEDTPDRNGLCFADRHRNEGNGEFGYGVIKWVYSSRGRAIQKYRVLYDGDRTQLQSCESHLELVQEDDDGFNFDLNAVQDIDVDAGVDASGGEVEIDNQETEDEDGQFDRSPLHLVGEPQSVGIGETATVGEYTWKRVEAMGIDVRIDENEVVPPPHFSLRNMEVTDDTTEMDLWKLMLPVTIEEMLEVVKFRAREVNDKYGDHWYREHIIAFCLCLLGASQFKPGTKYWTKEKIGLMRAPDFGEYITEDRFERVKRYLARGPESANQLLANDPWAEVRWRITLLRRYGGP